MLNTRQNKDASSTRTYVCMWSGSACYHLYSMQGSSSISGYSPIGSENASCVWGCHEVGDAKQSERGVTDIVEGPDRVVHGDHLLALLPFGPAGECGGCVGSTIVSISLFASNFSI